MKGTFPLEKFQERNTPFYYYDLDLLRKTLDAIHVSTDKHEGWQVHYAIKACANLEVLKVIKDAGIGADCVSGGEIQACLDAGFDASKIVFAGVGKADWEIELALKAGIQYFNVESMEELEVINALALQNHTVARIAFRINPNVEAHTHAHITTGLAENKFGIAFEELTTHLDATRKMKGIQLLGLHFHIGSQITQMDDFEQLCYRINDIQDTLDEKGYATLSHINVGGGLGIDYENPNENPIPNFKDYFEVYEKFLKLRHGQQLHFELGRAIVGQCGNLIARCLYTKRTAHKQFVIVDAGMTDLIRPALYGALHKIENLSSSLPTENYDVVGPICESSDTFAEKYELNQTKRGDILAIRSAGAYGEIMASNYNCRALPHSYTSEGTWK